MSEHITHIAIFEDTVRYIQVSEKFSQPLKSALAEEHDSGLICCGARGNHLFAIPILEETREAYKNGTFNKEMKQKLSGALGWLSHRGADLHVKPLCRAVDKENNPKFSGSENKMFHDPISFKEVYKGGEVSTLSDTELLSTGLLEEGMASLPAAKQIDVEKIEPLFTFFWQAQFLHLQKFAQNPDFSDEGLAKLFENTQDYQEDWKTYIKAYQNPDPEKMEKYITSMNFYDADDDILKLVRGIQNGVYNESIDVDMALEKAKKQSQYSIALYKSITFIKAADDFFHKKITRNEMFDAAEIFNKQFRY